MVARRGPKYFYTDKSWTGWGVHVKEVIASGEWTKTGIRHSHQHIREECSTAGFHVVPGEADVLLICSDGAQLSCGGISQQTRRNCLQFLCSLLRQIIKYTAPGYPDIS